MTFKTDGAVTTVIDNKGRTFIIDTDQIEKVSQYKWYVDSTNKGYVRTTTRPRMMLHKYLLGTEEMVDHINRVKTDNRLCNLRTCTVSENNRNREATRKNKLGIKGVYKEHRYGKTRYRTHIDINGRRINLGTYDTVAEAQEAYEAASVMYHKEFSPRSK